MTINKSVGAQRPIKIACISSPLKNKYSDTPMIIAHKVSKKRLDGPNFLMKFINID